MADAGAGWAMIAMQGVSMVQTGIGTAMKIKEAIGDYTQSIADITARTAETKAEAARRIGTTREEGVMSLKEQGAQAAFEGRLAMTGAEMTASSEEAKLGASGVRAKGSPLLAAQQNVDLAFAAADRTIERGNAGMALGGLRLKTGMADIGAQSTMATAEYGRQKAEQQRKKDELVRNKAGMVALATLGGAAGLASSFYTVSSDQGWFN